MTNDFVSTTGRKRDPPHLGKALKKRLAVGPFVMQSAEALDISRSQLHRILSGECALSAKLALELEVVIGSTADAWLRLQAAYVAAQARQRA